MATSELTEWYDWPAYYDIAMDGETRGEADFIEAVAQKYSGRPARHFFEPGCGSGRLVRELARRGHRVTGIDLNEKAIAYARRRLPDGAGKVELCVADMTEYRTRRPVDAAYNLCNTFRHLLTEEDAQRHLECVADSLRPGGVYVLGLHLLPKDVDEHCIERWSAERRGTRVTVTLRVLDFDRRQRRERLRISMLVRKKNQPQPLRLRHEFDLRIYTVRQLRRLLARVPQLEVAGVYDFWYDLEEPLELNDEITDTVLILRKRASDSAPPRRGPTASGAWRPHVNGADNPA